MGRRILYISTIMSHQLPRSTDKSWGVDSLSHDAHVCKCMCASFISTLDYTEKVLPHFRLFVKMNTKVLNEKKKRKRS